MSQRSRLTLITTRQFADLVIAEFGRPSFDSPYGDNVQLIWEGTTKERSARILEFVWGKVITFTVEDLV